MARFDLEKEATKVRFILEKKQIKKVTATVGLDLDISGSMRELYNRGIVQQIVERIIPVALNFDDNGELDVWTFSDGEEMIAKIESATKNNYEGFVNNKILQNASVPKWSGTSYCPVLQANLDEYGFNKSVHKGGFLGFGGKTETVLQSASKSGFPAIVYFITDGENDDKTRTDTLLKKCQEAGSNIYFLFIGIGHESFRFLEEIGDQYSNTGFLKINDITRATSDDAIYESLLPDELTDWLKAKGE
jgi:hypothetical protein